MCMTMCVQMCACECERVKDEEMLLVSSHKAWLTRQMTAVDNLCVLIMSTLPVDTLQTYCTMHYGSKGTVHTVLYTKWHVSPLLFPLRPCALSVLTCAAVNSSPVITHWLVSLAGKQLESWGTPRMHLKAKAAALSVSQPFIDLSLSVLV